MEDKIVIAKALKPQGIKGEIKLEVYTDDLDNFFKIKKIYINDKEYTISKKREDRGYVYIYLKDIIDRTDLESKNIIGKEIKINKSDRKKLKEGEFYISDILGINCYKGDELIGKVIDIQNYGSADVYTIDSKPIARFPLLKKAIIEFNPDNNILKLDEKIFEEIVCYED